jgi:hypothetical protein
MLVIFLEAARTMLLSSAEVARRTPRLLRRGFINHLFASPSESGLGFAGRSGMQAKLERSCCRAYARLELFSKTNTPPRRVGTQPLADGFSFQRWMRDCGVVKFL